MLRAWIAVHRKTYIEFRSTAAAIRRAARTGGDARLPFAGSRVYRRSNVSPGLTL